MRARNGLQAHGSKADTRLRGGLRRRQHQQRGSQSAMSRSPASACRSRIWKNRLACSCSSGMRAGCTRPPPESAFYDDCRRILGDVENADAEHAGIRQRRVRRTGCRPDSHGDQGRAGRSVLPAYMEALPNVDVRVVEAYSGSLTSLGDVGRARFCVWSPSRHAMTGWKCACSRPSRSP